MLQLFYGTDTISARTKALAVANATEETIERFESENFVVGSIRDAVEGVSLFGDTTTYIIDTPSTNPDMWLELVQTIEALASSAQMFIMVDNNLTAVQLKPLKTYLDKVELFTKDKVSSFNAFALADAFATRDKKTLWILLTEAIRNGLKAEEIIGVLWWQIKSMRLAMVTTSASEAGMKDFPYNKAKRALRNFKPGELESISHQLLVVYHEGHGGEKDIWVGLEEWILGI